MQFLFSEGHFEGRFLSNQAVWKAEIDIAVDCRLRTTRGPCAQIIVARWRIRCVSVSTAMVRDTWPGSVQALQYVTTVRDWVIMHGTAEAQGFVSTAREEGILLGSVRMRRCAEFVLATHTWLGVADWQWIGRARGSAQHVVELATIVLEILGAERDQRPGLPGQCTLQLQQQQIRVRVH